MTNNTKYILAFFLLFILTACVGNTALLEVDQSQVQEIKVSHFEEFGLNNGNDFESIDDESDINAVIKIIRKSKPIKGDVDMPRGDYNITFLFTDDTEQAFHLWLSNEPNATGTIMDIHSTSSAYEMSKKQTKEFQRIFFK